MGRKILGTTKPDEQQKKEAKYDEKNLQKAKKYVDEFFAAEPNAKQIAPFLLGKKIEVFVKENCDKKLENEINYLIFKKWAEN